MTNRRAWKGGFQMVTVEYKGYVIHPTPQEINEDGQTRWDGHFLIEKKDGKEPVKTKHFTGGTYSNREDAIESCILIGQKIIDEELPPLP